MIILIIRIIRSKTEDHSSCCLQTVHNDRWLVYMCVGSSALHVRLHSRSPIYVKGRMKLGSFRLYARLWLKIFNLRMNDCVHSFLHAEIRQQVLDLHTEGKIRSNQISWTCWKMFCFLFRFLFTLSPPLYVCIEDDVLTNLSTPCTRICLLRHDPALTLLPRPHAARRKRLAPIT